MRDSVVNRDILTGVAIGLGLSVVYNVITTKIFCDACKKAGGTCVYRCRWLIFCKWVCDMPPKKEQ